MTAYPLPDLSMMDFRDVHQRKTSFLGGQTLSNKPAARVKTVLFFQCRK